MALTDDYPTDPRLQPITIGTVVISFAEGGDDWEQFIRDRNEFTRTNFSTAPDKIVEDYLQALSNRVALIARRTLAETRPVYQVDDYEGKRGSILVSLDIGLTPADITIILGIPAAALYKIIKDYKVLRESAITIYNDLSFALTAIGDRLSLRWSHFLTQPAKVDSPMQRTTHHEDAETVFG